MRTTLVFPPRTEPTYMPLGAACLAAQATASGHPIHILDANLDLWNHLCDRHDGLDRMRRFARGPLTLFLDPTLYAANWQQMPEARRQISHLETQARQDLAGMGRDAELQAWLEDQSRKIGRHNPELIAFSAMYLDQLPFILSLAKYLAEEARSGCPVAIGGAAMSALEPEELLLAAPFIDLILTGEGEIPFAALLRGEPPARIPGCYHREEGRIRSTGHPAAPELLAALPPPDFSQLADLGYFNPVPVMPIYGCRGCKWRRCRFCSHNHSFGRHRQRPPLHVAMEMKTRQKLYGCRHFYMVDQYVDPEYLEGLCDAILALGVDCRFQIMARTIAAYTPALLEKAALAGCCWISWGMESGSQKLLDIMNKGTRPEIARSVIQNAAACGISNLLMMIFGAPGSDMACLNETFAFLDQTWSAIDGMTASAFVLFDQTPFALQPGRYGLEILGRQPLLIIAGQPVHDLKRRFRRAGESGRLESPLAAREIELWERRKVWLPPLPFHGRLCCEHYLLYADAMQAGTRPGKHRFSA